MFLSYTAGEHANHLNAGLRDEGTGLKRIGQCLSELDTASQTVAAPRSIKMVGYRTMGSGAGRERAVPTSFIIPNIPVSYPLSQRPRKDQ